MWVKGATCNGVWFGNLDLSFYLFYILSRCKWIYLKFLIFGQGGRGEAEEARWLHRRLAKGEPSGDEGTKVQPSGDEGTEEREDATSRLIKISVTLPPRGAAVKEEDAAFREEMLAVYRRRKARVSAACRRHGLGKFPGDPVQGSPDQLYKKMYQTFPWPPEKSLMYQEPWHLLYCWIHKVASTSWSKVFLQLAGLEVPLSRTHEATQKFSPKKPGQLASAISTSLVFTIVRHPFERLVSAYRDKFELAKKYAYIYSHYTPRMGVHGRPTFSQFVDYLLREEVSEYNDHWVPYWLHCHVCEMEYDVIGKMETLEEDMNFIAETSGLASTNISLPWANRRGSGEQGSLDYFRQLDLDRTQRLYAIYRLDFEMFGYSVQPYFDIFKKP